MQKDFNPEYIDACLKKGNFIEISSPRLKPLARPQRLKMRHRDIEHEAMVACELAAAPDVIVVPAVDAANRLMIVHIEPQQAPLREEPPLSAYERQANSAKSAKEKAAHFVDCISHLNSGAIGTYSELKAFCNGEEGVNETINALRRMKGSSTSVQTVEGVIELHLEKIRQNRLPGDTVVHCTTSFWGTQTHKGDILVYLRLDQNALLSILPSSSQLVRKVRLETEDKLRTLKILQALAFLDNEAEVVIGNSFELTTKTWQLTMHGFVDEALVMESLGVLGTHVPT